MNNAQGDKIMGERIGVAKAARLLGVKRADLNKRLSAAGVETFEGKVDFEKVKCLVPSLNIDDSEFMERVQCIRENPVKPVPAGVPTGTKEELAAEVQRLSSELMIETQLGQQYRQIIVEMAEKLGELQISGKPEQRDTAFELCEWLRNEITTK